MAAYYARHGIRVNGVRPGYVRTEVQEEWIRDDPEAAARADRLHALNRMGSPEEIARTIVFLCSEASGFTCGAMVAVDGGYIAFKDAGADEYTRT